MSDILRIYVFLRESVIRKKDGKSPLYLAVSYKTTVNINLNVPLKAEQWDKHKKRVKGQGSLKVIAQEYNQIIKQYELKVNRAYKKLLLEKDDFNAHDIRDEVLGRNVKNDSLLHVFDLCCDSVKRQIDKGFTKNTYSHYLTTKKYLKEFINKEYKAKDIRASNVNYKFTNQFEIWLKEKYCNHNGAIKHIIRLKRAFNYAEQCGIIKSNDIANYKVRELPYNRQILTEEEVKKIELYTPSNVILEEVKDVFLFCCYTGLSYSDVKSLSVNDVRIINNRKWIVKNRAKTNVEFSVPIVLNGLLTLDKYKDYHDELLLPVRSNQKMNKHLKTIAKECGINKHVSMHLARHTFATTIALNNNVPIETVSKVLGHTKLSTTQIYAKILKKKIEQDFENLL